MLDGFHKVYNVFALNHIVKRVETPNVQLGVGEGERLSPVNGAVRYPTKQKEVVQPELAHQSYELTQMDGFSDPLVEKDFPKDSFMGDPIAGIGGA